MARARSYRDLRVFQDAFRLAQDIFDLTMTFPPEEMFDLVRQARRSSRSVSANIAEAWRRRRYPASFVAKLIDAEAEATETRVHLEVAEACEYISYRQRIELDRQYDELLSRLAAMRDRPDVWIPRDGAPRGEQASPRQPLHPPGASGNAPRRPGEQEAAGHPAPAGAGQPADEPGRLPSRERPSSSEDVTAPDLSDTGGLK